MNVRFAPSVVHPAELPDDLIDGGSDGPDDDTDRVTLGTILDTMISALEEIGIEPLPGSVGAAGFTVLLRGHLLRIGFGVTMS